MYAFNAASGELLWRFQAIESLRNASPAVANGVVYFGADEYNLYALAAGSGKLLWEYYTGTYNTEGSPAVASGMVYFTSRGYLYAFHLPSQ